MRGFAPAAGRRLACFVRGKVALPRARWIVVSAAVVVASFVAGIVAWRLTDTYHHPATMISSGSAWYSHVGGKRLTAEVSDKELAASPQWAPNAPLPLRAEDAILRAKEALPTLGPTVEGWSFSELTLREETSQRFFYTVTFRPRTVPSTEWVQLVVYLNGKVVVPNVPK